VLKKLELFGYRGFESHSIDLRKNTLIVGHNNAGKSTIVEILRCFSIITNRLAGLQFSDPPNWTGLPLVRRGVTPSLDNLGMIFQSITNRYSDRPAKAVVTFSTGESIELYINNEGRAFANLFDSENQLIPNKARSNKLRFPTLQVLPQITPLLESETILQDHYVRRNYQSPIASRHFRNQLRIDVKAYKQFRQVAQETWPSIQIQGLEGAKGHHGQDLRLNIRDRDFVAEVGFMGHGLQMWLQTMWFLCRCSENDTVVLDEPDVYMHPDLQRKLVRLVWGKFRQVLIATHSVEIIADVDPSEILIVDRSRDRSRFADSLPAVQKVIRNIGGVHNVHLARLWSARKFLLVEGKDLSFLKHVHDKIFRDSTIALDDIPNSSIGGWANWQYALGQSMGTRNALGETVRIYCILDSDYHIPEQLDARKADADEKGVELHIWERKELENYFLDAAVFARIICGRDENLDFDDVYQNISNRLYDIALSLENEVFNGFATNYRDFYPQGGIAQANNRTRELLNGVFENRGEVLKYVSGKEVLKQLSRWADAEYGRGVSFRELLKEFRRDEISEEVHSVVQAIEHRRQF